LGCAAFLGLGTGVGGAGGCANGLAEATLPIWGPATAQRRVVMRAPYIWGAHHAMMLDTGITRSAVAYANTAGSELQPHMPLG